MTRAAQGGAGERGVALMGVALCVVAALFDTPALYIAGAALVLIAFAAAVLGAAVVRTTRVVRTPQRGAVEEDEAVVFELSVSGPLVALGAGQLAAWPGAEPAPLRRAARRRPIQLEARLPRRGRHRVGPSELRVSDPFGIGARTLRSGEAEVLVLPRVEALPRAALQRIAGARRGARSRTGAPRGAVVDADSLAPHRPGAPASRIHWPTVARTGKLHERRLGADADRRPLVVLNTAGADSEAALDACVRAVASLCRGLGERGGCTVLLPGEPRPLALAPDLHAWPQLHARLALVTAGVAPAATAVRGAVTVLWVSAAREDPDTSGLAAGADLLLVSPFPRPGRPVAFVVAGCAAQRAAAARGRRAAAREAA